MVKTKNNEKYIRDLKSELDQVKKISYLGSNVSICCLAGIGFILLTSVLNGLPFKVISLMTYMILIGVICLRINRVM